MKIDNIAIKLELERVLSSRCFRSRHILRKFLSYIVQETMEGRADEITQYAIATKGLGKPSDFIAGESPLIRVQAGRLRALLLEYYSVEGRLNPVRISLPVGGYAPEFEHCERNQFIFHLIGEDRPIIQSLGPSIICVPRNFIADDRLSWSFINRLTRDYVTAASRFNYCQIMFADEYLYSNKVDDKLFRYGADFSLFFDNDVEGKNYHLKCSLVNNLDRQIIWAQDFNLGMDYPTLPVRQQIFKRIANDTIAIERGIALSYWARQLLHSGKPIAAHYQLLVTGKQYTWELSRETFRQFLHNCEQRLEQFPDDVTALCALTELCRNEYFLKFQEIKSLHSTTAHVLTRLSQLAPENSYTPLFHVFYCLINNDLESCEASIEQAQAMNPLDNHLNNLAGLSYIALGQWDKGAAIIQSCIDTSPLYPDWYHIALCLYYYRKGQYLRAAQEARKVKLRHLWTPMLRAALYQHANWLEESNQAYQKLTVEHPNFAQDSQQLTDDFTSSPSMTLQKLWHTLLNRSSKD